MPARRGRTIHLFSRISGSQTGLRPRPRLPDVLQLRQRIPDHGRKPFQGNNPCFGRHSGHPVQSPRRDNPVMAPECRDARRAQHHHGQHDKSGNALLGGTQRRRQPALRHSRKTRRNNHEVSLPSRRHMLPRGCLRPRQRRIHKGHDTSGLLRQLDMGARTGMGSVRLHNGVPRNSRSTLPRLRT